MRAHSAPALGCEIYVMTRKNRYSFLLFTFCATAFCARAHDTAFLQPGDSLETRDMQRVSIARDDTTLLREIFASDTFDKIADIAMVASEVQTVPDSVIRHRLAVLDARTPLSLEFNPEVRTYINMYLGKRRELVARMVGLSMYYYDVFESILDRYDIPSELKHLTIIESALNPKARSRVGATGLWQFMYDTGRIYNLYYDSYVDERFDPVKSTEAAARLLKRLYDDYGDWYLALAAYNYGSGNVNKAIARSGGKRNYWEVRRHMPAETSNYVAAFIAANYIMNYYREHGIVPELPQIAYRDTDTIRVKSLVSFDLLSQKLDIPIEELQFLNPAFKLNAIPYTPTRHYSIVLPADKALKFAEEEEDIYREAHQAEAALKKTLSYKATSSPGAGGSIVYRVRKGDTLGHIAARYGVSVSKIKSWNRLKSDRLSIGQRLTIYPRR